MAAAADAPTLKSHCSPDTPLGRKEGESWEWNGIEGEERRLRHHRNRAATETGSYVSYIRSATYLTAAKNAIHPLSSAAAMIERERERERERASFSIKGKKISKMSHSSKGLNDGCCDGSMGDKSSSKLNEGGRFMSNQLRAEINCVKLPLQPQATMRRDSRNLSFCTNTHFNSSKSMGPSNTTKIWSN